MSMLKQLFHLLFPGYSLREFLVLVAEFRRSFYELQEVSKNESDMFGRLLFGLELEAFHGLKKQILEVNLEHPEFVKTYVSSLPRDVWKNDPVCSFLRQSIERKATLIPHR